MTRHGIGRIVGVELWLPDGSTEIQYQIPEEFKQGRYVIQLYEGHSWSLKDADYCEFAKNLKPVE